MGKIIAPGITAVRIQKFVASGTYTPDPNMLYCIAELVGAGAAGGGVTGALTATYAGGGGGSGAWARSRLTKAQIGASQVVTIGAGGTAVSGADGNAGGTTSLGALVTAPGGAGGKSSPGSNGGGAVGGTPGTGDETAYGGSGKHGRRNAATESIAVSGEGGDSRLGAGAAATASAGAAVAGGAALGPGGGGSGAAVVNNASNAAGGIGGDGIMIITEFCSS